MEAVSEAKEGVERRGRKMEDTKSRKDSHRSYKDPELRRDQFTQRRPSPSKRRPRERFRREVVLPDLGLSSRQLAALAGCPEEKVFKVAADLDDSVYTPRTVLSPALIELITEDLKLNISFLPQSEQLTVSQRKAAKDAKQRRMPIITVMGHVDHGKTSLLDALRHSHIAQGEAGGITQSVAAFEVPLPSADDGNEKAAFATFIDTPGHAAFKAMRANGTVGTDIVVLVIAADDGVMPQTMEAAKLARLASVPIIAAINKCDAPGADPERVRYQLLDQLQLNTEQLGGDVQCVDISAKTGANLPQLLDAISLQAEMLDLQADLNAPAAGVCLESRIDRALGSVATIVVRNGVLRAGDFLLFQSPKVLRGDLYGRVRSILASDSKRLDEATPGMTVGVIGIKTTIPPGAEVHVVDNEKLAKAKSREMLARNASAMTTINLANSLLAVRDSEEEQEVAEEQEHEGLDHTLSEPEKRILTVLVKGDVQGSADAVAQCIQSLETSDLNIRILAAKVGDVNDMDMKIISTSRQVKDSLEEPIVVAFNVRTKDSAMRTAKRFSIPILTHSIIYHLEDEVKNRISDILAAGKITFDVVGKLSVIRVFEDGAIAGCTVEDGSLSQGDTVRVMRLPSTDAGHRTLEEAFSGSVETIKRYAKTVKSVGKGTECGVSLEGWSNFESGDVLEVVRRSPKK